MNCPKISLALPCMSEYLETVIPAAHANKAAALCTAIARQLPAGQLGKPKSTIFYYPGCQNFTAIKGTSNHAMESGARHPAAEMDGWMVKLADWLRKTKLEQVNHCELAVLAPGQEIRPQREGTSGSVFIFTYCEEPRPIEVRVLQKVPVLSQVAIRPGERQQITDAAGHPAFKDEPGGVVWTHELAHNSLLKLCRFALKRHYFGMPLPASPSPASPSRSASVSASPVYQLVFRTLAAAPPPPPPAPSPAPAAQPAARQLISQELDRLGLGKTELARAADVWHARAFARELDVTQPDLAFLFVIVHEMWQPLHMKQLLAACKGKAAAELTRERLHEALGGMHADTPAGLPNNGRAAVRPY